MSTPAFLTGSHAFGKPTKRSDVDLVLLISADDVSSLITLATVETTAEYLGSNRLALRIGNLNLICCMNDEQYNTWKLAHEKACLLAYERGEGISKEEAAELFTSVRKEAGIQ